MLSERQHIGKVLAPAPYAKSLDADAFAILRMTFGLSNPVHSKVRICASEMIGWAVLQLTPS